MYKVQYTNGSVLMVEDEVEAMSLYHTAEGRADVYAHEEGDWFMIADGYDFE